MGEGGVYLQVHECWAAVLQNLARKKKKKRDASVCKILLLKPMENGLERWLSG